MQRLKVLIRAPRIPRCMLLKKPRLPSVYQLLFVARVLPIVLRLWWVLRAAAARA